MILNDQSDYMVFIIFCDTVMENIVTALLDWYNKFVVHNGLLSDVPTHSRN